MTPFELATHLCHEHFYSEDLLEEIDAAQARRQRPQPRRTQGGHMREPLVAFLKAAYAEAGYPAANIWEDHQGWVFHDITVPPAVSWKAATLAEQAGFAYRPTHCWPCYGKEWNCTHDWRVEPQPTPDGPKTAA